MHLCVNTPIIYISLILKRVKNGGLRLCICAEVNLGALLNQYSQKRKQHPALKDSSD